MRRKTVWHVYLLKEVGRGDFLQGGRGNRSSYVGMTNDVTGRVAAHNAGSVTSTRMRKWELVATVQCKDQSEAAMLEQWLKSGDTTEKRAALAVIGTADPCEVFLETEALIHRATLWNMRRNIAFDLERNRRRTRTNVAR